MDWFERLTGFAEREYADTRTKLHVDSESLVSVVNGKRYGIGSFELVSLQTLRDRVATATVKSGQLVSSFIKADVRQLHQSLDYANALFQVASQFNCLEMLGPSYTPECGVTIYREDHTQGPACAIAAGAATIFRNYFVLVGDRIGQTRECQLDGLADLGNALCQALNMRMSDLWTMSNGYALCTQSGLSAIRGLLKKLNESQLDSLRGQLRIGLHHNVEVTESKGTQRLFVSQAFCSALPVAYSTIDAVRWAPFARLVLEAAYEATLLAAVLNHQKGGSNIVVLTHLGGGAFGNRGQWIDEAIQRSLKLLSGCDLDVRIVSYK